MAPALPSRSRLDMTDKDDSVEGLVDHLYDVALDPERLEHLVDAWTRLLGTEPTTLNYGALAEPGILPHVVRAEKLLRDVADVRDSQLADKIAHWLDGARAAALVVDRTGSIVAVNAAASAVLNARIGAPVDLPVDEPDMQVLLRSIRSPQTTEPTGEQLLRLARAGADAPVLVRVVEAIGGDQRFVGLITSILMWPSHLSAQLQQAFTLTQAEVDVLRDLTLGQSVKMIAARTQRGEPTVRSHVKAILAKAGVRSQVELIRLTLGLLEPAKPTRRIAPLPPPAGIRAALNDYRTLKLADRRRLDYLEIGADGGRAFLMLPTDMGFTRLPRRAEHHLAERGLRMIVPIRAGYGHSSPLPRQANAFETAVGDMWELCDHLGVARCPILALCDDFHLAVAAAHAAPERVSAIVALGPTMPAVEREHFARMPKWTRFIFATARHAPGTLPYLALAFFGFIRRIGPRRSMHAFMGESKADMRVLGDDEVFAALLAGSEIAIGPSHSAHAAWAAGAICNYAVDWSDKLAACPVPMIAFAGHHDPFAPIATTREYAAAIPSLVLHEEQDLGQLLYPIWPRFLAEIETHLD